MKPQYLPPVCQTHVAHYEGKIKIDKSKLLLKKNEVVSLRKFCDLISADMPAPFRILDGYYVGFSIPQIANEFDLLRFGTDYIVNIELKSKLSEESKIDTIITQMHKQHYYLKFLEKPLKIYTYIEDDGIYYYDAENNCVESIEPQRLVDVLVSQNVDFDLDPDKLFKPSNYLVSPFNKVDRFMSGEYFLTTDQAKKKKEILDSIDNDEYLFFCISADAGTGKTLLTYDIAKTYQECGKSVLVLHCANLNEGQYRLTYDYHWNIKSASSLRCSDISHVVKEPDLIVVDEAHRIWKSQLEDLVTYANEKGINILFSYDPKQYLRDDETKEIHSFLIENYPEKVAELRRLTTKIRTNKRMASFIHNMMAIGSSQDNLNYDNITIEYFSKVKDAQDYLNYLDATGKWKAITFTPSQYSSGSVNSLSCLCDEKAHGVIGQEFDRVVFAMDSNFRYSDKNRLSSISSNYYSLKGMLYQIVTRAVEELKIIVINNPELYQKLISIKYMGEQSLVKE